MITRAPYGPCPGGNPLRRGAVCWGWVEGAGLRKAAMKPIRWDSGGTRTSPRVLEGGWGHSRGHPQTWPVEGPGHSPCESCLSACSVLGSREGEPQTQTTRRACASPSRALKNGKRCGALGPTSQLPLQVILASGPQSVFGRQAERCPGEPRCGARVHSPGRPATPPQASLPPRPAGLLRGPTMGLSAASAPAGKSPRGLQGGGVCFPRER